MMREKKHFRKQSEKGFVEKWSVDRVYLTVAVAAVLALALGMVLGNFFSSSQGAVFRQSRTADQVRVVAQRFLATLEALDASVSQPVFDPESGTWAVTLSITQYSGEMALENRVLLKVYDSNLSLASAAYLLNVPNLSEDKVVSRGVLLLNGSEDCGGGKVKVFLFLDPYCPVCALSKDFLDQVRMSFGSQVSFEYHYVPTSSQGLMQEFGGAYPSSEVELAAEHILCAQEQDLAFEMEYCVLSKYEENEGVPLSQSELDECVSALPLDPSALSSCLSRVDQKKTLDYAAAYRFLGQNIATPSAVVNCRYRTNVGYLMEAICYANPTLSACSV